MTVTWRALAVSPGKARRLQTQLAEAFRAEIAALEGGEKVAQTAGFVFARSKIEARHFEAEPETLATRHDWVLAVNEATHAMAKRATVAALEQAALSPADCDALIVASSTYAGFPSLSRRLQDELGIAQNAACFDLTGLGCAAPTHGLDLADMLIATGRARRVCLVCVDAMGTHGALRRHRVVPDLSQVVAHCLASDGAAAVVLEAGQTGAPFLLRYERAQLRSRAWRGSLGENDLTADADNQPLLAVGKDIRTRLSEIAEVFEDDDWLSEPMFLHPGGAALMKIIRERYPTLESSVALSSAMLAQNGNVGAPSVLWVLDQALKNRAPMTPRMRLFALGPGIVTTVLTLDGITLPG